MLRTLYLKTVRDRWVGAAISVGSLFLVAWMGLWAYAGVGGDALDFINSLPDAYTSLLGVPADSGSAGMLMSQMFNMLGPFVLGGIAISMGAHAFAGEENDGTMNVLASIPRSRGRLLASTTAGIVTVILGSAAATLGSFFLAVAISGSDAGSLNMGASAVHLALVTLVYGLLALAVGCASGSRSAAVGTATGLLVISFLGAGLLPLFDGWADLARIFPWYYLASSLPLVNGVDWAQIALLTAVSAALIGWAWVGVRGRDLRTGVVRAPLVQRLTSDPRVAAALARLQGSGSARGLLSKTVAERRAILSIAGGGMLVIAFVQGLLYPAISGSLVSLADALPEGVMAMVGGVDFSTPQGWYFGEALAVTAPIAMGVVAVSAGAAMAGEERRRTIAVLLGTPTSRARAAWISAGAMALAVALVALLTTVGIAAGNAAAGLGVSFPRILASGVLLAGLGLVLGAATVLGTGLSGRPRFAAGLGTGVAVVGWAVNAFIGLNENLAGWARVSPFYYYAHENPLETGMRWADFGVLVGVALVLVVAGVALYRRRDLQG